MPADRQLIYRVSRQTEGEYTIDRLWIAEYSVGDATARLAGTVGNRDGYDSSAADGGAASAARMSKVFAAMLDAKHPTFYDFGSGDRSFTIRYQVYQNPEAERPDYCQPRLSLPDGLSGVRWALKLIEKFGKRLERIRAKAETVKRGYECDVRDVSDDTISQMQDVATALDMIGAVEVVDWRGPSEGWYSPPLYYVPKKK